ncbi:MAG: single-stranded-DNA-specific exonuclease RecJ [Verrucomicrobium sp.]|nr:single-stranded-DNA-specific exonuclease RecJ [Verrucomicrobium sp.]
MPESSAPPPVPPLWVLGAAAAGEEAAAAELSRALGVEPLVAALLVRRGFPTPEAAQHFLTPRLGDLFDPFLLTDLKEAAITIAGAVARREPIAVFGDYDADGITSSALLCRFLRALGGNAEPFLPLRREEGYGLTRAAAARCLETLRPKLLVAVDCGTSSHAEIAWLKEQGVEAVVVDHHELPETLPACRAFVNPHRDDPAQPAAASARQLASVGLVFKLCHGLLKLEPAWRERIDLRDHLDLVAVGTVADLVPLRNENRILVRHGLARLDQGGNPGLQALIAVAGVRRPVTADDIGFRIAPRINASGRLDDAAASLRLLLTDDPAEAARLAEALDGQNRERQTLEQQTYDEALSLLGGALPEGALILGRRGWHVGVIGIVASRLQKRYGRPAIVIGIDENGEGKGSGRSVEGCSLVLGLQEAAPLLLRFGGHEMAAGLSIREEHLPTFQDRFNGWLRKAVRPEDLVPRLRVDAALDPAEISENLYHSLDRLAPFGRENPQPVFALRRVALRRPPQAVKRHIKLFLDGEREAIGFGFADRAYPGGPLSIAGSLSWDDYRGRVQVRMIDWKREP